MNPTVIPPTVGRIVHFYDADHAPGSSEQAAIVCHVWSDTCVNLAVFDHNGNHFSHTSVRLVQEGEEVPESGIWCQWMPYQIGQARKEAPAAPLTRQELTAMRQSQSSDTGLPEGSKSE